MKKAVLTALAGLCLLHPALGELASLSHLFAPGKTLLDADGDGLPDRPAVSIIIPDNSSASELALAADIAARISLESLALDFGLVRRESEVGNFYALPCPILIGTNLPWSREAFKDRKISPEVLGPNRGLVFVFSQKGQRGIVCLGGSDEALLETGRAFFLRWPYFWEIWGRETGATYFTLEKDLERFLSQEGSGVQRIVVREALYEFPSRPTAANALQALSFKEGQIRTLTLEVHFADNGDREKAEAALRTLEQGHRKGVRTEVLSYAACAELAVELCYDKQRSRVLLPRTGSSKRLLTPGFRERPAADPAGRDFDLLGLFSAKGFYSDQDGDGILDGLESAVIIPGTPLGKGVAELSSRLQLATAGGSFPVVYLDSEVESRKALAAPILVGPNTLTQELLRTGKLKLPALETAWGLVRTVPKAFGKSGALVIQAADGPGLERTLSYFARTFPYLSEYGEGHPQIADVASDFEKLLRGEKGGAEAYFMSQAEKTLAGLKGLEIESFGARIVLPRENRKFDDAFRRLLEAGVNASAPAAETTTLRSASIVFQKEKEFPWEAEEALTRVRDAVRNLARPGDGAPPLKVSIGVSESPQVRQKIKKDLEQILEAAGHSGADAEVLSAYKPGFYWLTEEVLPALRGRGASRLSIRFAVEREDLTRPERTYSDPSRWVQELYPVDEILARELGLPLDRIEFEARDAGGPTYDIRAWDDRNAIVFEQAFSARTRDIPLFAALPEWGTVTATCGWVRVESDGTVILDSPLETDLEKFWTFYQEEVLRPLVDHILKKTGQEPTFSKQPYFKRLLVELWASEPDYRLGLDEEIVSSLEAIHDEIYFDTLDLLRGITRFDPEDKELPPDSSRSSAPGNVLPTIHPSLEGGRTRVKVTLEDWPAAAAQVELRWKERNRQEVSRKIIFPTLKLKELRVPGLIYNGQRDRLEDISLEADWDKEADYLTLIEILGARRTLGEAGLIEDDFSYPGLQRITVRLRFQDQDKEERLPVAGGPVREPPAAAPPGPDETIVTTREILSPAMCGDIIRRLSRFKAVRSYVGGKSYEGRDVPVIELYLPLEKYVAIPRLVTFKPTLQVSARQHANEVSATNYLLRFVELLARDRSTQEALKKMNFALQPMENPDGAELAYGLQKNEPFHSLHAGRYGSLGVDIGYQAGSSRPLLPEAAVRTNLASRWLPDVFLNLHGYPSHEWVQPFSNYSPYLFRDYWIPKGWFTYFRSLNLPIYEKYRQAGEELMGFIVREMQADERLRESNRKFYDRYRRWAGRWAPHIQALELVDGVNIFAKRRSSAETKISPRTQTTYVEETPEVMDETATGSWLSFLCDQGLAYLRAHVKYLTQARHEVVRLEEEVRDRVRITFLRGRPGETKKGR